MFEKEAEEYAHTKHCEKCSTGHCEKKCILVKDDYETFKDGAEFGYNKANEWHYAKDGDFPEKGDADFIRILIVHHNHITIANYDGDWKSTAGHKISIPYAWKELPKPPREESELSEKNTK